MLRMLMFSFGFKLYCAFGETSTTSNTATVLIKKNRRRGRVRIKEWKHLFRQTNNQIKEKEIKFHFKFVIMPPSVFGWNWIKIEYKKYKPNFFWRFVCKCTAMAVFQIFVYLTTKNLLKIFIAKAN